MEITKKINLDNNTYYVLIEVEYEKHREGFPVLRLKNYQNKYWDGGDCSLLIEKIEESYSKNNRNTYDKDILFMNDILYIYDRIPFLSGIKEVTNSSETYISKEEIETYIKTFKVKMNNNRDFKLYDERTWYL